MKKDDLLTLVKNQRDEVLTDHNTENILEGINDLCDWYEDKLNDLEEYIEGVEEKNKELQGTFEIPQHLDNIVSRGILEQLFENLERIPMDKLELFINKFKG